MFCSAVRLALLALATAALPVIAVPALSYDIATAKAVEGVDSLTLKLTVTNKGNETLTLLNDPCGTLSKLPTDAFKITNDESGKSPEFYGADVKYVPEIAAKVGKADAFTKLKPGESFYISHNLGDAYNFTSTGAGSYTISPSTLFHYLDASGAPVTVRAPSSTSKLTLSGSLVSTSYSARTAAQAKITYGSCTAARKTQIARASQSALALATGAYTKLKSAGANTARYRTWFGAYTSANRNTVYSHYSLIIQSGFSNFKYDCTCTDSGTFAYVYPTDPSTVYLCGAFWSAPLMGTDSQAGTLVHESSHFRRHGGTQDYAYGQTDAKKLAIANPARAIFNADSHEYYAENTPALA